MKDIPLRLTQRLINWRYGITPQTVLNDGSPPSDAGDPVDAELKKAMNHFKATAFSSENGGVRVDYAKLKNSEAYTAYRDCALRLDAFDPAALATPADKLAFWINVYNALLIDAVIAYNVQRSVNDIAGFFWRAAYNINGYRFSTIDIEHGILRANAGHTAIPGPQFTANDPRRHYAIETIDPRIHFALVCASHSCPPVAVYDAQRVDEQLDLATRAFVNGGGAIVNRDTYTVDLSRLFQWYAADFGSSLLGDKTPVLEYVAAYLDDASTRDWIKANLDRLKVRYQRYDWSLNGANAI